MVPERVDRVRELCARWVKEGRTPALSVCVARRGVVVLHEAFGRLGPEEDAPPLERNSLFTISSATKPITATLVMQLCEEGAMSANRKVQEYLPEVQAEGAHKILVHHLLTHTSGYPFHTHEAMMRHVLTKVAGGFEPPPCPDNQHPALHRMNAYFYDAPLQFEPGSEMVYSNINYEFLGEIVRRVSGRAVEDLARERIFDPLGMDDSWYALPESEEHRVVRRPDEVAFTDPSNAMFQGFNSRQVHETPYGGMGVLSTPRDLASFQQIFLDGGRSGDARILSPPAVAAMTRNQIPGVPAEMVGFTAPEASWGYGWTIESHVKWEGYSGSFAPIGTCNHGGMGGTYLWIDPVHEIVAAYCEVALDINEDFEMRWNADLFQGAVMAAVAD